MTAAPALPDHDPQAAALAALYATLGAVAGNWMRGDPVWLLLVGPPPPARPSWWARSASCPTCTGPRC